jgi:hypothetical protein
MTKFEPGKTYYTTSSCDHNCIYTLEVISRTEKTIRAIVDGRKTKTLRPSPNYRGTAEKVAPHGRYSMAALIDATDTVRPLRDWEKPARVVA